MLLDLKKSKEDLTEEEKEVSWFNKIGTLFPSVVERLFLWIVFMCCFYVLFLCILFLWVVLLLLFDIFQTHKKWFTE